MQCCPWTRIETAFVILKGVRAAGAFFVGAPGFWRDVSRETSVTRGLRRTAFMETVFMHQGRLWPLSFRFPACGALPPRFPFPTLVPARLVRRSLDFAMRPVLRGLAPVSVTRVCVGGVFRACCFTWTRPASVTAGRRGPERNRTRSAVLAGGCAGRPHTMLGGDGWEPPSPAGLRVDMARVSRRFGGQKWNRGRLGVVDRMGGTSFVSLRVSLRRSFRIRVA